MKEGIWVPKRSQEYEERFKRVASQSPQLAYQMIRWTITRARELTIENLRGKVLKKRSGFLMGSIQARAKVRGTTVNASLFSNMPYARVHEEGSGYLPGGAIRPRHKQYLRFRINGEWKTVKEVRIPERPYMRPAVTQSLDEALGKEWWKL